MELVVFVGIPASGKSTESEKYRAKGYRIISSDEIRGGIMKGVSLAEISKEEQDRVNAIVFDTLYEEVENALSLGESVVVDATHLNRKIRTDFLKRYKKFPCVKKCVMFITPFGTCLQRNRKRSGPALVPDDIMKWMLSVYECPWYSEGWDIIEPVISKEVYGPISAEVKDFPPGTAEYRNCKAYLSLTEKCYRPDFTPAEFPDILHQVRFEAE